MKFLAGLVPGAYAGLVGREEVEPMTATLPELALKSAEPLLEALQSGPEAATPDEAEDLLLVALQGRDLLRRCWKRTLAALDTGMSGDRARSRLDVMVRLANVEARLLGLVLTAAARAEASRRAEATEALCEAQEIEAAARAQFEFVNRPARAADPALLARGMAAYERGETEGLKDAAARLRARSSS
jgi:hypothetical protein